MPPRIDGWLRYQQHRWRRPDAARWLRPDAARFLKPGTELSEVYPWLERKYPGQPRLPEGEGHGQYTFGRMNGGAGAGSTTDRPRVVITQPDWWNTGTDDGGDDANDFWAGLQLAGDLLDGLGAPSEEPPEIPRQKPKKSSTRTAYYRTISNWLVKNPNVAESVLSVLLDAADWLQQAEDMIQANRDPAKTLQELMDGVGKKRRGYDDHHIMERTAAEAWGLTRSQIDDPSNLVSIPRLKHYQITGWYSKPNRDFGGLSPREYLADKLPEERRAVGLQALRLFEVLKP